MPIEFKEGGSGYSLGVEEELCIVDATTGELVPKIEEIMSRLPDELGEFVSYELFQSVLEIKTPPCASAAEAERHLRELRGRVGSWAAACGASLASVGTHPFSRYRDQKVTDQERYRKVIETLRWIAQREVIFGQHVHVAVPGPEESIIAHNRLSEQTPLLLALSANSPFWQGFDTGFESSRVKIFETFPRAGLPPAFPDYEAFEGYVDLMVASGAMEDYTYLLVGCTPAPQDRDDRAAGPRLPDEPEVHDVPDRPHPVPRRPGPRGSRPARGPTTCTWRWRTSGAPPCTAWTRRSTTPGTRPRSLPETSPAAWSSA